jgi:signal recognition particle GTPase
MSADFTLDHFAKQLKVLAKYSRSRGPLEELLDYFRPGRDEMVARIEKIIAATEPSERENPSGIGPVQRQRIAASSGVGLATVEAFFAGYERLQARMQELAGMSLLQRLRELFRGTSAYDLYPWFIVLLMVVIVISMLSKD